MARRFRRPTTSNNAQSSADHTSGPTAIGDSRPTTGGRSPRPTTGGRSPRPTTPSGPDSTPTAIRTSAEPSGGQQTPAREFGALLILVFVGGGLGTLARASIDQAWPAQSWPWAIFCINLLGTAALAWLLTYLASRGPETRWGCRVRLGVGTGLLGGFTTYSAFGVQIAERIPGSPWIAVSYALGSLAAGLAAAFVAARLTRSFTERRATT